MSDSSVSALPGQWRTTAFRWVVFAAGLVAIALVMVLGKTYSLHNLDWPLLVLTLDAVLVGLLSGPMFGVIIAILSAVSVQYFIIFPANTWKISNRDDQISLLVFVSVSIGAVLLAWYVTRARASEVRAQMQARVLATAVDTETTPTVQAALQRVQRQFDLERVEFRRASFDGAQIVIAAEGGPVATGARPNIDVELPDGHRLVGFGRGRLREDRVFVEGLAAAVYRAYDSQRLTEEQAKSKVLAAADSARAAVLAAVGHDLRTPLAGLRVALDGLQAGGGILTGDETDELLDTAERSTRRLDQLITNLIDLSRLQAGVLPVSFEATDIGAVVEQARSDLGAQRVTVNISESLPLVWTDPVLLERIISNLLSNAVRHTPDARPVDVTTTLSGQHVTISVVDHGVGLDEEGRSQLLVGPSPAGRRSDGGAGLGLAIVRQLTSALGGELLAGETVGGGLTVSVQLPLATEEVAS